MPVALRMSSQGGRGAGGTENEFTGGSGCRWIPVLCRGVERASADQLSYSHAPDHFSCHNDQKSVVVPSLFLWLLSIK